MVKQRKGAKEELITPMKTMEPKTAKPTPEQMRIAQILEKKVVDSSIKLKLKQIMDATQRPAEEVYVALYDSDFDVNRAVNLLIEGENQLADWCTNEKRKKKLAELKEKKEEEGEAPQLEKNEKDDRRRLGRRQDGRRPPRPQEPKKKELAPRKRPGFGSLVFERSNPPPVDTGSLPPVKNHWEKPLVCLRSAEDDWDCEEFQGSLAQTLIFPSKKLEQEKKEPSPQPPLPSLTFINKAVEGKEIATTPPKSIFASKDKAAENRVDLFRLSFNKEDRRSKIPTSAVEMPPELMPSLSFLDIQFGAMDLSLENAEPQQNPAPTSPPPSVSLMSNTGNSDITKCSAESGLDNVPCSQTSVSTLTTSTTLSNVSSIASSSNSIVNTLASANSVPTNSISGIGHLIAQNSIQPTPNTPPHMPSATNQRYTSSSQVFNGSHMQYGIINPPGSYESRDAPHVPHSHLPPYKSPPGVPKGSIVPNLPPGPIVSNQYLVGQGNVPYFPHPPIYYYEEVPSVMNPQQRLNSLTSHYDVTYPAAPSSRDTVHYNV